MTQQLKQRPKHRQSKPKSHQAAPDCLSVCLAGARHSLALWTALRRGRVSDPLPGAPREDAAALAEEARCLHLRLTRGTRAQGHEWMLLG